MLEHFRVLKKQHKFTFSKEVTGNYYHLLDVKSLAKNIYQGPEMWLTFPDGKIIKVREGAKLIKTLAKIVKQINWKPLTETFEVFRLKHSMIGNTKTLKGDLCLSIHPLDYMTLSDNTYNWSSCMSWVHGEYRIGTIEMLNSPYVVVGYLRGQEDKCFDNPILAKAYAKKWRSLFIVSEEVITNVKGYPYQSEILNRLCVNWLKELSGNKYSNKEIIVTPAQDEKIKNNAITRHINFDTNLMYNDMGLVKNFSYFKKPIFEYERWKDYFDYSGPTQCFRCNSCNGEFSQPEVLICDDCYEIDYIYCDWCGEKVARDSEYYFDNGYDRPLCYHCYTQAAIDPIDKDIIFNASVRSEVDLHIVLGDASPKELAALGYMSDEDLNEWGWSNRFSLATILKNPEQRNIARLHLFFGNEASWEKAQETNCLFDSSKIYIDRGRYCIPVSALTNDGFFFATDEDNHNHGSDYNPIERLPILDYVFGNSISERWNRYKKVVENPDNFTLEELLERNKTGFDFN